jgi:Flp pilus assembly pilin Flp
MDGLVAESNTAIGVTRVQRPHNLLGFDPRGDNAVSRFLRQLWCDEHGQDIAEYAVMLAVVLVIVVGTIRLIGANSNNVFSQVASSVQ